MNGARGTRPIAADGREVRGDESLQRWAGIAAAEALWTNVKDMHGPLLCSALELDRPARLRRAAGLTAEPWELALHRGYWTALRIAQARGVVEGAGE